MVNLLLPAVCTKKGLGVLLCGRNRNNDTFCENDIQESRTVVLWNVNSGFSDGNSDFGVQRWKCFLFLSGTDQIDFRRVGGKNELNLRKGRKWMWFRLWSLLLDEAMKTKTSSTLKLIRISWSEGAFPLSLKIVQVWHVIFRRLKTRWFKKGTSCPTSLGTRSNKPASWNNLTRCCIT